MTALYLKNNVYTLIKIFLFLERERKSMSEGGAEGERERTLGQRERERTLSRLQTQHGARCGLDPKTLGS